MEFAFDENQLEFRPSCGPWPRSSAPRPTCAAAWESELGWSRDRWRALAEMGVVGVAVPESDGGLGLEMVDLVLLLEEAGRAGLPEPLLETACLAGPLLASARVRPRSSAGRSGSPRLPPVTRCAPSGWRRAVRFRSPPGRTSSFSNTAVRSTPYRPRR